MENFEMVFILKGSLEENKANEIIKTLLSKIYNKVKNDMNKVFIRKKDLVYEINREKTGYYCLVPYYRVKEEIGEDYTVDEVMEEVLSKFDNIVEFNDCLEGDLEI